MIETLKKFGGKKLGGLILIVIIINTSMPANLVLAKFLKLPIITL